MTRPPSNARELPKQTAFAINEGTALSPAQQSAAIALTGWMKYPTSIQINVDNEVDFKAISAMMFSLKKPLGGIGVWGKEVNVIGEILLPGKYTIMHREKVFFTVYLAKVV
jgi:hypothetical protein